MGYCSLPSFLYYLDHDLITDCQLSTLKRNQINLPFHMSTLVL